MAIQFARTAYVSRSSGGNACLKSSYNARTIIDCERTGQRFNFKDRTDNVYHNVILPENVNQKYKDSSALWNLAEQSEKRINSQVAKEAVFALPDNPEVTISDRIELIERFVKIHFVDKGLAVQIDIHSPHENEKNWHAHILMTTRRFKENGLDLGEKARDLNQDIRKGYTVEGWNIGDAWKEHQNNFFKEKGIDIRVDPTNIIGEKHIGPVRMRKHMGDALERANILKEANEEAIHTPSEILKKLTRNQATFSEKDLDILLNKHLEHDETASVKEKIFADPDLLRLHDKTTKEETPFWTTKTVRSEEEKLLRFAHAINEKGDKRADRNVITGMLEASSLTSEQKAAVEHATTGTKGLAIIEGRAGTGKSFTMGHIRDIYEQSRHRVIGLAPTNQVVQDMKKDGFSEAHTVHSFLFKQKNGRLPSLNKDTILIVDEAAMLGNSALVELFNCAKNNELKVVLFGDDRQLSSVERGGMFPELISAFGSKELTEVRRQSGWHKEASEMLSQGQAKDAVRELQEHQAIYWVQTKENALKQLVEDWEKDSLIDSQKERLVLASRNVDVDALNSAIRNVRLERGEISTEGYSCQTARGKEVFSTNDRICLTVTNKDLGLYNGAFGTIKEISEKSCTLELDGGKTASFDPNLYHGLKLGYAATVYKSQGKSIADVYVLHDATSGRNLNYVALTRHKESLKVYLNQEETKSLNHFASQLSRSNTKSSSLSFISSEELEVNQQKEPGLIDGVRSVWHSMKNAAKTYISDTFHKNDEFYDYSDSKKEKSVSVEKVIQGELKAPEKSEDLVVISKTEKSLKRAHDQPKDKREIENSVSHSNITHSENEPVKAIENSRELPEKLDTADSPSQFLDQGKDAGLISGRLSDTIEKSSEFLNPSTFWSVENEIKRMEGQKAEKLFRETGMTTEELESTIKSIRKSYEESMASLLTQNDVLSIADSIEKSLDETNTETIFPETGKTIEQVNNLQDYYYKNQSSNSTSVSKPINFCEEVTRQLYFIKYQSPMSGTDKSDPSFVIFEQQSELYPTKAKSEILAECIIERFKDFQRQDSQGKISDEIREDFQNALKEIFKHTTTAFYIQTKDRDAYKAMEYLEQLNSASVSKPISFCEEVTRQLYFLQHHSSMPGTHPSDPSLAVFEQQSELYSTKAKSEILAEYIMERFREYQRNDTQGKISNETREDFKNGLKEVFKHEATTWFIQSKDRHTYKAMNELSNETQRTTQHQRGFEIEF